MLELRRAIRTIQEHLQSGRTSVTTEIQAASEVYAAACREMNDRLIECQRLIFLHQRSEALRQVQLEPDALTLFQERGSSDHS